MVPSQQQIVTLQHTPAGCYRAMMLKRTTALHTTFYCEKKLKAARQWTAQANMTLCEALLHWSDEHLHIWSYFLNYLLKFVLKCGSLLCILMCMVCSIFYIKYLLSDNESL